jgi:hypothetical protein
MLFFTFDGTEGTIFVDTEIKVVLFLDSVEIMSSRVVH